MNKEISDLFKTREDILQKEIEALSSDDSSISIEQTIANLEKEIEELKNVNEM